MENSIAEPTELQQLLLQSIQCEEPGRTWEKLTKELSLSPDDENSTAGGWAYYLYFSVLDVWEKLPMEARMVAYIMAHRAEQITSDWTD